MLKTKMIGSGTKKTKLRKSLYGIFSHANISDKDIDKAKKIWKKCLVWFYEFRKSKQTPLLVLHDQCF